MAMMNHQQGFELGMASLTGWIREWTVRKGWREEGDHSLPDALGRTFGDEIALMHSELSEALEAFRDHGIEDFTNHDDGEDCTDPDPALCTSHKPEGVASELADTVIRIIDTCAHNNIDLAYELIRKMGYNETRSFRHGGRAL